jgi:hypothetical protein
VTVDRCRELLGPDCRLSDEEVERVVDDLNALAHVLVGAYLKIHRGHAEDRGDAYNSEKEVEHEVHHNEEKSEFVEERR